MDYLATIDSPVGSVTVASDGEAIVGLWLEGQKHFEATLEAARIIPICRYSSRRAHGSNATSQATTPARFRP